MNEQGETNGIHKQTLGFYQGNQIMNESLPSYAFCVSDENGFVDFSDFVCMTINYVIEKEMGLI